ncbi:unnamed protein product [Brachionus calyciflorus]|uniref:Aminotransferase class I/classII large domain-containing protein n=1 Tax=Brachionus calyciflorus TaxID=104777 RepID=A0A814HM53_9BILA|nr:unnamed protein product [Brachionus calyciflorus]
MSLNSIKTIHKCFNSYQSLNGFTKNLNKYSSILNHRKMSDNVNKHYELNSRYAKVGDKNVWVEFTALARDYNAVNLGQGFPDYDSVKYLNEKALEVSKESNNLMHQYTRSPGHLRLANAIAKCYGSFLNREINPQNEVLVTVGAYGSLFNALSSFVSDGDEVIIIEPFYDCYAPMSAIAGAKCVFVPLRPKTENEVTTSADWVWDEKELESAFSSKTKLIVVNTPNNPLGKIYSREELQKIADLCIKHNTLCISDEVYEHITYDRAHTRIATLPGMWERTITVGSAGKAFSSTGAKLGWTIGPKELIRLCQIVHNNSIYCCPTFIQEVIARCFELEIARLGHDESYFKSISAELKPKRDRLAKLLIDAGLKPVIPEGGYFMLADISTIAKNFKTDETDFKDSKFVKYLIKEKGLATIPNTAFYSDEHKHVGENFIRFCFFKNETTLEKAAEILKNLHVD